MGLRIYEDDSYKEQSLSWDKVVHSFDPEIDILPEGDKRYFQSLIYWLVNKESALSNIPPSHMYSYIKRADFIFDLKSYPMVINAEFVRKQLGMLIHRYKIRLSENALAWLFGPLSHTTQHVKQELVQHQPVQPLTAGE